MKDEDYIINAVEGFLKHFRLLRSNDDLITV